MKQGIFANFISFRGVWAPPPPPPRRGPGRGAAGRAPTRPARNILQFSSVWRPSYDDFGQCRTRREHHIRVIFASCVQWHNFGTVNVCRWWAIVKKRFLCLFFWIFDAFDWVNLTQTRVVRFVVTRCTFWCLDRSERPTHSKVATLLGVQKSVENATKILEILYFCPRWRGPSSKLRSVKLASWRMSHFWWFRKSRHCSERKQKVQSW